MAHDEAVTLGRRLAAARRTAEATASDSAVPRPRPSLFAILEGPSALRTTRTPFVLSTFIHLILAVFLVAALASSRGEASLEAQVEPAADTRLVFLASAGPGGGGGGGGLRQKALPAAAQQQGLRRTSSPVPPHRSEPPPTPEPTPAPLNSEPLPILTAPVVSAPAGPRDRVGVLQDARVDVESHGPGQGGAAGTGRGDGLGEGQGSGIGQGSGGGTGGGPYRPGSGIMPPRLLREIKADYTDAARRAGITGEVLLEIVVRRDGTVGEVRIVRGLSGGLSERAVDAVRQWRFTPATRHGSPVDVLVEVGVEFKLR